MEYLPEIISALAVIITAWFSYNQYAKNKLTDLKVEQMQRDNEVKRKRRSDNSALVHGELWEYFMNLKPTGFI